MGTMENTIVENDRSIVQNDCQPVTFRDHGLSELARGQTIGPVCWAWHDLLCVHRGKVEITCESHGSMVLVRGQGLLFFPDTGFKGIAMARGARISVQHFHINNLSNENLPSPLARLQNGRHGFEYVDFLQKSPLEADIHRAIDLAFTAPNEVLYDMRLAQLVLILGQLIQHGQAPQHVPADPRAVDLQRKLSKIETTSSLTATQMAAWVNLSPSRFRVWFKARFGQSPKQYLVQKRLERAMRLLRETRQPIKSIAIDLGYADLPTFYHDFQRHIQITPAQYRQQHTLLG